MTAQRQPSLGKLLNDLKASTLADIRVSIPGRIEKYDASTQLADVQPLVKDSYVDRDGSTVYENLPIITNVPVQFPGSSGLRIMFPISVGDTVLLVFADRSIDSWQTQGGISTPTDERRHDLSDAFAIPGFHDNTAPFSGAEDGVITVGSSTGASEFVATAQRVLTELQKIQTAFNAHTHTGVTTGAGTSGTPSTSLTGLQAPASATVKIKG